MRVGAVELGKTDALIADAVTTCLEHPGAKVLFLRRNFTDLNQPGAAIPRSQDFLATEPYADWNGTNHQWTFSNGSIFKFGHLSDTAAITQYLGTQVDRLLLDQAEQLTFDEYTRLRGSVRATVDGLTPCVRLTANPGGIGHAWVKARFIDAAPPGQPYVLDDNGEQITHRFVPSRVSDNQRLLERDPNYVATLRSLGGALARAWLEGDWDTFEGQYFPEFNRDVHVVAPFKIPEDWPRWRCIDYGFSAPMCCLWLARSPSREIYCYRELYGTRWLDHEQAFYIRSLSAGESYRATFADPSMWSTQPNGSSVAGIYAEEGVALQRANNDRLAGWQQVRNSLAWSTDPPSQPKLHIFANCLNLIRTLPSLVHDHSRVEDCDSDGEDH